MRKSTLTAAIAAMTLGLVLPTAGFAEDLKALPAPTPMPMLPATPAASSAPPAASPLAAAPLPSAPSPATAATTTTTTTTTSMPAMATPSSMPSVPTVSPGMPPMGAMPGTTTTSTSTTSGPLGTQPATPKIVQDAVAGLQKTDPINLDDMIRAQDAINRLDLLLEIEKRQAELKKLRDERNKVTASASPLGAGIPASALNLPPMKAAVTPPSPSPSMNIPKPSIVSSPSSNYSLKRIMGAEGRYSAVLVDGGSTVTARPGETLPDGSKVKSVSLTSVSLVKDGKRKNLTIPSDAYIVRGTEEVSE
jgi:type IV pilus biogenesis protein PilP